MICKPVVVTARLLIFLSCLLISSCGDTTSLKIRDALTRFFKGDTNYLKASRSPGIDSITYSLADSTVYYNHFLNSLADRSESLSKMAKLRTSLARAHMDNFLSGDKKENYQLEKNKLDVDKSLQDLQQNERLWNAINDSMDLMLSAVHTTDTSKKVFYDVNFSLKEITENEGIKIVNKKAILNKDDLKVVFVE